MSSREIHGMYVRKYGLRAERFVDKIAADFFKKHFPDIPYYSCYNEEWGVEWYREWVNDNYPLRRGK